MRTPRDPILRHASEALRRLLPTGGHVLVAVSGGRDSMVLADAVRRLARSLNLAVTIGHVHHGLRGPEADHDMAFVEQAARAWKVPSLTSRVNTKAHRRRHGGSLEEAARVLRYRALERMRQRCGADLILTAHHADDQAETVFLRATRGAHRRGLAGILPVLTDPPVARPLLQVRRSSIERYVDERRIAYREDDSNTDLTIRRNLVRQRLLRDVGRWLKADPLDALPRLATAARALGTASDRILQRLVLDAVRSEQGAHFLATAGLDRWPLEVQNELLMRYLRCGSLEPTVARLKAVRSLLSLPVGRWRPVGGSGWRVYREREGLSLVQARSIVARAVAVRPGSTRSIPGGRLRISRPRSVPAEVKGPPGSVWVDVAQLNGRLMARLWKPADRFIPLGMSASRKVSDLLTDRKVPAYRKRSIPVVLAGRRIIWVCGIALDERVKVRPETKRVLQFSFQSNV